MNDRKVNPMTNVVRSYALTYLHYPVEPLKFPYSNTKAGLGVMCTDGSLYTYISLNHAIGVDGLDHYKNVYKFTTRVKWGDQIETTDFVQESYMSNTLYFKESVKTLEKIIKHDKVLVEFHLDDTAYFEISLKGADKAVKTMLEMCGEERVYEHIKRKE